MFTKWYITYVDNGKKVWRGKKKIVDNLQLVTPDNGYSSKKTVTVALNRLREAAWRLGFKMNMKIESMNFYEPNEVFEMIGEEDLDPIRSADSGGKPQLHIDGFDVYRRSLRYQMFYHKGCTCVKCGRVGTYFKLDCDTATSPEETNRRHFNLYSADNVLMTKDHILPKSWGGKDTIENMQTMCSICNSEKGNICDVVVRGILGTPVKETNPKVKYISIENAVAGELTRHGIIRVNGTTKHKADNAKKIALKTIETYKRFMSVLNTDEPLFGYVWSESEFNLQD